MQECGAGPVPVSVEEDGPIRLLRLHMPQANFPDLTEAEQQQHVSILGAPLEDGLRATLRDVGARWIVAKLGNADAVLSFSPDWVASAKSETELGVTGVSVFGRHDSGDPQIEVRSFAPSRGVTENPVCGSGNGSIEACRLLRKQVYEDGAHTAAQGQCVGRSGQIFIRVEGGRVNVGG